MTVRQPNAKYYFYLLLLRESIGLVLSNGLIFLSGAMTALLYLYYTAPSSTPLSQTEWFDLFFLIFLGLVMLLTGLFSFHEFLVSWRIHYTSIRRVWTIEKMRREEAAPYLPREIMMLKGKSLYRNRDLVTMDNLDAIRGINL